MALYIEVQEECHRRMGLVTHPYLYCCSCSARAPIGYKTVGSTRKYEVHVKSVFAYKCAGGTLSRLELLHCTQGLPHPVSRSAYANHAQEICRRLKRA